MSGKVIVAEVQMVKAEEDTVWRAAVAVVEKARSLSEEQRAVLLASRIKAVVRTMVLLEVPDRAARELVETTLLDAITSALSQLANGFVAVVTTVRPDRPAPAAGWLSTAAQALRE